jgi:hypothetical protein
MDSGDRSVDSRRPGGSRTGTGARDPRDGRTAASGRQQAEADRYERDPRWDPAAADDPVWDGQAWVRVDPRTGRPERERPPEPSGPLVTPLRVTLAIGLVIGVALMAYAVIIQRGQDVPFLAAAAFVLGIVCAAYGITAAIATYRAAADGRGAKAFGLAVLGGIAVIAAFGFLAMATIFGLLWQAPTA